MGFSAIPLSSSTVNDVNIILQNVNMGDVIIDSFPINNASALFYQYVVQDIHGNTKTGDISVIWNSVTNDIDTKESFTELGMPMDLYFTFIIDIDFIRMKAIVPTNDNWLIKVIRKNI